MDDGQNGGLWVSSTTNGRPGLNRALDSVFFLGEVCLHGKACHVVSLSPLIHSFVNLGSDSSSGNIINEFFYFGSEETCWDPTAPSG